MNRSELYCKAEELYESYLNGNITHVINEILHAETREETAFLSAIVFHHLNLEDMHTASRFIDKLTDRALYK